MKLSAFVSDDSNPFGPGTDLMVSLLAFLLIICLVVAHAYDYERHQAEFLAESNKQEKEKSAALQHALAEGGNFKQSSIYFNAGEFAVYPVTKLTNEARAASMIQTIMDEYGRYQKDFPFIFIIGHANQKDDPRAYDQSYEARLQRNWEYAGRRAGVIASLLQAYLTNDQKSKIIVVSTGEFDLSNPSDPISQDNAWVEVVFGKEWKIQTRTEMGN